VGKKKEISAEEALLIEDALCREHLSVFVQKAFPYIDPGATYLHNWHVDCICEHVHELVSGANKRLVVNIPPRYLKSIICSVCLPAWLLGRDPSVQIIVSAHSASLSDTLSIKTRDLMLTPWYQNLFPETVFAMDQNTKNKFLTKQKGYRLSTSVDAKKGMGEGADWIIWDDLIDPQEAFSKAKIDAAVRHMKEKLITRLNNKKTGRILGIMQRISPEDPTKVAIDTGQYKHLCIEFKAMKDKVIEVGDYEYHIKKGDYIHPEREDAEVEEMLRNQMSPYAFSSQYQQNPIPPGGGEFKMAWVQRYDNHHPDFTARGMNIYILVDPAGEKKIESDWTSMVVVGLSPDNNYYLLDMVRDKLDPKERIDALFKLHKKWNALAKKPPSVAYEKYGLMSDTFWIHETQKSNNYRFNVVEVGGTALCKEDRIRQLIPLFQQRRVYIPDNIIYYNYLGDEQNLAHDFVNEEFLSFPSAHMHDDMLDALARICDTKLNAFFPKLKQESVSMVRLSNYEQAGDFYDSI
jgi:predicted phage terminase large subunit-like protein